MTANYKRVRVLVVEDNRVNQRVAAGLLSRRGHDVTIAQNGSEAVTLVDTQVFDVVSTDATRVRSPDGRTSTSSPARQTPPATWPA